MSQLAEKIKECRDRLAWSQEHLAREMGISVHTVHRWETGKSIPSPLAMEKLQKVLDEVLEGEQLRMFLE